MLQVGPSVQKYLPGDLNPKIKEQLGGEMGAGPQGTTPPGPPPPAASSSAAPAPAKKPAANASRKKSDAGKAAQQHEHQAPAEQRGHHQAEDHAHAGNACCVRQALFASDISCRWHWACQGAPTKYVVARGVYRGGLMCLRTQLLALHRS